MGIALAADETAAATFANGLQNSGFIKLPAGIKPPTKEQKEQLIDFFGKFAGSSRAGKMLPLDPGMEFQALGLNPDDAQLLQSRGFNVEEICRWYRVPPFMVGHTEKSTSWGTGLEQQGITFKTYVINTYLCRTEQAIWKQLIPPADRARLFAEFNLDGLLRADSAARGELYWKLFQVGAIDANWIAGKENIPMSASGNRRYINSTLAPIDDQGIPMAPARPVQPAPGEPALGAAA
jgi:HK97 family phage portal protein